MWRKLTTSLFLGMLSSQVVLAQPNYVKYPVAQTQASTGTYRSFTAAGGLSNTNTVTGSLGNPTLDTIWQYADNSLQQQDLGAPGGVAGLNSDGYIINPVSAAYSIFGTTAGHNIYNNSSTALFPVVPRVNILNTPPNSPYVPTSWLNNIPYQDMITLGGIDPEDKMFFNVSGQPYGGGQMAVVDSVFMDGSNMAQGTGVTAGGWNNMLTYGNYDAVARSTMVKSPPPYFIVSASIADPDGVSHTVSYTATGATFTPALPAYWGKKLRVNMNVMTNWVGADPSKFPTSDWTTPWSNHSRHFFNTYGGTITSWVTNSDGTVPSITVDGWVIPQQASYGLGTTLGKVPGVDTLDGTTPSLDTWFTQFSQPTLMVGIYTKQFTGYSACSLEPQKPHGDTNNPNGTLGSLTHECDYEDDLWNSDPIDYKNSIHGHTITVLNTGGKLTDDSYLLGLQGGGAMPKGFLVWNVMDYAPIIQMFGNGTSNQHTFYSPTNVGLHLGDSFADEVSQYSLAPGGNYTASIRWMQYRDKDVSTSATPNDWNSSSIHLQMRRDWGYDPRNDTGSIDGQLVFEPVGYPYGVGLGAGGSFKDPNYGIIVDSTGMAHTPHGIQNVGGINTDNVSTATAYKSSNTSVVINLPLDKLIPDDNSMFTVGAETAQFGGMTDSSGTSMHRSISVFGQPYGNYNAGCTVCMFTSGGNMYQGNGQAAISGTDYRAGASAVAGGDFASVGFYHYDENWDARVTTQAASFGPGVVTLVTPMTDEQMLTLHTGMYVKTNVINPSDPTVQQGENPIMHSYHGFIKSWDATHIYVYDWAVPGDNNTSSGQVPNTTYLDSTITTYTVPMVWVGVPDKHFAENTYTVADGNKALGSSATNPANTFEREEYDFRAMNWNKPHSVSFHGNTVSFQCIPCNPNAITENSRAYLVNGPGLPTAYRAQLYGDGLEYSGYSSMLGANGAPEVINPDGTTTTSPAVVTVGTNHIMSSFMSSLPSNNNLIFTTRVQKEQMTDGTWHDYGIRMGLNIDGNRDRRTGLTGGTEFAQLGWNVNGDLGSLCLLSGGVSTICSEGNGTVSIKSNVTFAAGSSDGSYTLATLPNTGFTDGTHVWCKDCVLNTIAGVEVYWHSSVSKWTDVNNNNIVNH